MKGIPVLVREVMSAPVTVRQGAHLAEAAAVLLAHDVPAAPVVDDRNRIVGVVSDIDVISHQIEPDPRAHERCLPMVESALPAVVDEVMTRNIFVMTMATDVADLVTAMRTDHLTIVPIVRGEQVVGVVTRRDVLRLLHRDDAAIERDVARSIEDVGEAAAFSVDGGVVTLHGSDAGDCQAISRLVAMTVPGVLRVQVQQPSPVDAG